jgi:hypothetical protein
MARETGENIDKPSKKAQETGEGKNAEEEADLEGYTGPDGSKSLGYLKHEPVQDSSGLGSDADDAGRTNQEPGANSGASPQDPPKP